MEEENPNMHSEFEINKKNSNNGDQVVKMDEEKLNNIESNNSPSPSNQM